MNVLLPITFFILADDHTYYLMVQHYMGFLTLFTIYDEDSLRCFFMFPMKYYIIKNQISLLSFLKIHLTLYPFEYYLFSSTNFCHLFSSFIHLFSYISYCCYPKRIFKFIEIFTYFSSHYLYSPAKWFCHIIYRTYT